jgi:WS/DGAT/MGAT family acyltransferase
MDMRTREIRRVREEHAELRLLLMSVEALSQQVLAGDPEAVSPLRQRGLELHAQLCRHLDFEERELLPAIEAEGSWGRELAARVRSEHEEQRLLLRYILEHLSDESRPARLLGNDIACFAAELREDMSVEDRSVLLPLAGRGQGVGAASRRAAALPRTMGFTDALLWRMEGDPRLRGTTAAITLLARSPDRKRLRDTLERASRRIPRLRQRVLDLPVALATPVWLDDPDFDLDYHLRWLRAPGDGSLRAVLDLASSLAMQAFDRDRPLWEFFVVEDLEGGRAALIQKLHHAVMDGMAGVALMGHVYADAGEDAESEAGEAGEAPDAFALVAGIVGERLSSAHRGVRGAARALLGAARSPARTMRELGAIAANLDPRPRARSPLLRGRSTRRRFEAFEVPVAGLKTAAATAGCRLNDAFLAALAGGWRRYHQDHGTRVDRLCARIAISRREGAGAGPAAGNCFDLARIEVPVADSDPVRRMRALRANVARERERTPAWTEAFAAAVSRVPPAALRPLLRRVSAGTDFLASCVRGPADELAVGGARVEAIYAFGPTAGAAANATFFSLGERAFVTLNVDPAAVPDPARLAECMQEGFDEVLKLG